MLDGHLGVVEGGSSVLTRGEGQARRWSCGQLEAALEAERGAGGALPRPIGHLLQRGEARAHQKKCVVGILG